MKKTALLTLFLSVFAYAKTGDWVAQVNGKTISQKEFESIFNTQLDVMEILSNYQMDVSKLKNNKQYQLNFLDNHIATQLMVKKIRQQNKFKKFVDEKWVKEISAKVAEFVEDNIYIKYYVEKVLLPKTDPVTDNEIAKVYDQYKEKFKNVPATQAAEIIKKKLQQQKALILLNKLRERVKNEASIKINYESFGEE